MALTDPLLVSWHPELCTHQGCACSPASWCRMSTWKGWVGVPGNPGQCCKEAGPEQPSGWQAVLMHLRHSPAQCPAISFAIPGPPSTSDPMESSDPAGGCGVQQPAQHDASCSAGPGVLLVPVFLKSSSSLPPPKIAGLATRHQLPVWTGCEEDPRQLQCVISQAALPFPRQ